MVPVDFAVLQSAVGSGMLSENEVPFTPTCERSLKRHVQSPTRQIHGSVIIEEIKVMGRTVKRICSTSCTTCMPKLKTPRLVIKKYLNHVITDMYM